MNATFGEYVCEAVHQMCDAEVFNCIIVLRVLLIAVEVIAGTYSEVGGW